MQLVRDERQVAVSKIGHFEVGESVVFTHGPGTVEALQPDGGITVKAWAPGAFRAKIVSKRERDLGDQRTYTSSRMLREGRGGPGEARCATASSSSNATLVSLLTRSTTGKHRFGMFLVSQC